MWDSNHHAAPVFVIAFYALCHYCSAVTMYKELDCRDSGDTFFRCVEQDILAAGRKALLKQAAIEHKQARWVRYMLLAGI